MYGATFDDSLTAISRHSVWQVIINHTYKRNCRLCCLIQCYQIAKLIVWIIFILYEWFISFYSFLKYEIPEKKHNRTYFLFYHVKKQFASVRVWFILLPLEFYQLQIRVYTHLPISKVSSFYKLPFHQCQNKCHKNIGLPIDTVYWSIKCVILRVCSIDLIHGHVHLSTLSKTQVWDTRRNTYFN